ncbi:MAG: aminotransferase class I/II-fold pyridoxal phosphate-dependent enzyme [Polyangiaceae bacterium]
MTPPSYAEKLRARADAIATACVHAGEEIDPVTLGLDAPISLSSAFAFRDAAHARAAFEGRDDAYIYGRWGNPTVRALEAKVAALEGCEAACATASGMAAISGTILAICSSGDHVIAPRSMYAESARLLRERLPRFGIRTTFVDASPEAYAGALEPTTRIAFVETPSNPRLGVIDVAEVAARARAAGVLTVVDGTFATPFSQSPAALGADLVVHSMTKGMSGHGDVIAGCVAGPEALVSRVRDHVIKGTGAALSPFDAWLVTRSLRTLAVRQERACATAAELASWLAADPRVAVVYHPSLATHAGHEIAARQMHAFGSLLSFELAGADAIGRGARVLERVRIATHAVSLGDARTLIVHPASTTHSTMPPEARALAGIGDGLLRVSVGLESAADLERDLDAALGPAA